MENYEDRKKVIDQKLLELRACFAPDAKLSLVVYRPGVDNDSVLIVTTDIMENVFAQVDEFKKVYEKKKNSVDIVTPNLISKVIL